MITWEDFNKIDIRVGTFVTATPFPKAGKPGFKPSIDLGSEIGTKNSRAQITDYFKSKACIGQQAACVVNFRPKKIGGFSFEVLVTGFSDQQQVVCSMDKTVPNGARLF